MLQSKTCLTIKGMKYIDIFEFTYKTHGWSKSIKVKSLHSIEEFVILFK